MKNVILASILLIATAARADVTGQIDLAGTVPEDCSIQFQAAPSLSDKLVLLTSAQQMVSVDVDIVCNTPNHVVKAKSMNGGLRGDDSAQTLVPYRVSFPNLTGASDMLSDEAVDYVDLGSMPANTYNTPVQVILPIQNSALPPGNYSDSVQVQISSQ